MQVKKPQIIISIFLCLLVIIAYRLNMDMSELFSRSLVKFVMNGVLVLAMIPMINAGIGMNFGLPIGIMAGLLGMCISIELRFDGFLGFFVAILSSIPIAIIFGIIYGKILNQVKGKEDIAAMFIGFAFIPIMNFFWTIAPFTNREMLYPIGGKGLRPKISLDNYFGQVLNDLWMINLDSTEIPLGLLIFYTLICVFIYLYFNSRKGKLMEAIGENEIFCILSGVDIDKTRIKAVVISTIIAGIGIIVYAQSYGFVELYGSPSSFTFPAISSILIGGCIGKRATLFHAVLGTFLYQTTYLLSTPIANALLLPEVAEIIRMIITNGIILYAFLKVDRRKA
ncbi:MAG: ABC transporter permease [Terrisporobacter sp.]|uniref:ABC transporter permease subunit n=1 Tax=Terrisporobacter sp. TaxID=1965305 RepID=UPI002FCBF2E3